MDVAHWKKWFLFPYAKISPLPDIIEEQIMQNEEGLSPSDKNFNRLVSRKYQFPIEKILKQTDLIREL